MKCVLIYLICVFKSRYNKIGPNTTTILGFSDGFSSKKMPKSDRRKKYHLVNLYKSFYKCPTQLGNQNEPCHFDWQSD